MTATIIDGKAIAKRIKDEIAEEIKVRNQFGMPAPGLATVLVGDDPASQIYLRNKIRTCEQLGIRSFSYTLPVNAEQAELEQLIRTLNENPEIHGILVQLPLPPQIDEYQILSLIAPQKDVDGFHPINAGMLSRKESDPWFIPCTPSGILILVQSIVSDIAGKEVVVIGRSSIVGMPTAQLLCRNNATVTICHRQTQELPKICRRADILVVAVGNSRMVKSSWVKPGAVVIDVGINRIPDPTDPSKTILTGDTDFDEIVNVASAITPVPGGVGPMTIAILMRNTLAAARREKPL